ncbi:MAG: acyltransferase, partial [Burkholderiales bacterium]
MSPHENTGPTVAFDPLPDECLVDLPLAIRLRGASPGEGVTLSLFNRLPGTLMRSVARFVADPDGTVDLTRDAPLVGAYTGVDPMGLFWSRAPVPDGPEAVPVAPSDDPFTVTLVATSDDNRVLARHAIHRVFLGPGVRRTSFDAPGRVGLLFEPASPGPNPAVLVVGGSDGGLAWSREVAGLLASHGFVALALAYFGAEGLPATLDRIPLEYFDAALDTLAALPSTDADRVGVFGASRGGELALLLGARCPRLRAVAAFMPSGVVWPAYPATGYSAWTAEGRDWPCTRATSYEACLAEPDGEREGEVP